MRVGVQPLTAPRGRRLRDGLHPLEAWGRTAAAHLWVFRGRLRGAGTIVTKPLKYSDRNG